MKRIFQWAVAFGSAFALSTPAAAGYTSYFGQLLQTQPGFPVVPTTAELNGVLGAPGDERFSVRAMAPNSARDGFRSTFSTSFQDFENVRLSTPVGTADLSSFTTAGSNPNTVTLSPALEVRRVDPDPNFFGGGIFSVDASSASTERLLRARAPGRASTATESVTTFELTFSEEIMAFGFYATDLGDQGATMDVELFSGTTLVESAVRVPNSTTIAGGALDSNVLFFGLRANAVGDGAFNRVRFTVRNTSTSTDVFGLDDIYLATREDLGLDNPQPPGVPEPGSIALAGLALAALGARARRRR